MHQGSGIHTGDGLQHEGQMAGWGWGTFLLNLKRNKNGGDQLGLGLDLDSKKYEEHFDIFKDVRHMTSLFALVIVLARAVARCLLVTANSVVYFFVA